jgi:hypothetical protein
MVTMDIHGCITTSTTATWNGGSCGICGALYLGSHTCSVEDLLRKSDELRDMAMKRFEQLRPQPTRGPEDQTSGCPCRPENGGSGVCGCILGGQQITC